MSHMLFDRSFDSHSLFVVLVLLVLIATRSENLMSLWEPPQQAGWLKKQQHRHEHDSTLFYFRSRSAAADKAGKVYRAIPLENAKIETLPPTGSLPRPPPGKARGEPQPHTITVTLHTSHALTSKHAFFVLAAPSTDVQSAWVNALWQAAIPRASLIQHLQAAGCLADVVAAYAAEVTACFPVADAAVLSTGGRATRNASIDMGSLAATLRSRSATMAAKDPRALPDPAAAAHILARTASGGVTAAEVVNSRAATPAPAAASPLEPQHSRTPSHSAGKLPGSKEVAVTAAAAQEGAAPPKRRSHGSGTWHDNPTAAGAAADAHAAPSPVLEASSEGAGTAEWNALKAQ
eukprot:scaffold3.g6323.t1